MATLRKRYVDPDVSGGAGDGTSWANAYASLNAAEQAEDNSGALTTSDEYVEFVCGHNGASQTTADTTAVTISGWTTGATQYIHVYTESADRHAGVWSDTKYRLLVADASNYISEDYVRVDGLQIGKSSSSGNLQACLLVSGQNAANDIRISNSIIKQAGNASYTEPGIYLNDLDTIATIWNCIVYGLSTNNSNGNSGFLCYCATANLYGCTVVDGYAGIRRTAGTVTAKNCYAGNTNTTDYSGTITLANCASEDTSAGSSNGCVSSVAYSTDNFESVTPGDANNNYLKVKSGGALHEAGTTLSDDPPGSTALGVDIAGNSRS